MEWITSEDLATAELAAAQFIARRLTTASEARGRATLAISGGSSPWGMFARLADQDVPWREVHVFQVDERIVPARDPARNWQSFLSSPLVARLEPRNLHPMPVEIEDTQRAVAIYEQTLSERAGDPPELDVVHLGIGPDGHTASLFPDDALLQERQHLVGASAERAGYRRLTLTLTPINGARDIVWFIVGRDRREAATRLFANDPAIPASRVERERATCFTDPEAAPES